MLEHGALSIVLIRTIQSALDYDWVKIGKYFVFFQDHWTCPWAVIYGEVKYPLMCSRLSDIVEEFLEIALVFEYVFVKVGHLGDADDLAALLEECRNSDVLGEGQKSVEVA